MKRPLFALIFCLLTSLLAVGRTATSLHIIGIVRDSVTTEALPYASVTVDGAAAAAVADSRGIFDLQVPPGAKMLTASCQGYASRTVPIVPTSHNLYDINLPPVTEELKELVVEKKKYSKKNNPAVDFARRLRNARKASDPLRNDYYSYSKYERVALGINRFDTTQANAAMRSMPFLAEHVDTSLISGKPVLKLMVKERISEVDHRRSPRDRKTTVKAVRNAGIDEMIDAENVATLLDEFLREVDLYDDNITLLRNSFVSPLSAIAPDFYRFYLVDDAQVEGDDCTVLAFYPRNKAMFGFTGHVYVAKGDSTMFVRRVTMSTPAEINLNFVKALTITQDYDRAPDGSRLKRNDDMAAEMSVVPGMPELYMRRNVSYGSHSFAALPDSIFSRIGELHTEAEADRRDSTYWAENRASALEKGESQADQLMARLRSRKAFYWGEKLLKIMVTGYIPMAKDSKFDYGPVNTTVSYNSLEGVRLRAGGMTTAALSPHWFGRGYLAYGFKDRKWKYSAEAEYSFNAKKNHSREFPMHAIRLLYSYDVDRLGSHYLYTNSDNFVLSLARQSDRRFTYRRLARLSYILELGNHFSIEASVENVRQEATPWLRFVDGEGRSYGHYTENVLAVELRYAPGETFYQSRSYRIPVRAEAPVFRLSHRWAPQGFAGSNFAVNRTEVAVSKLFRLSFLGELETELSGGHVWCRTVFPELFIPNANLSYTIQPGSFALMNPLEFINSSYVALHATYNARGALFNLIPGVRRTGLREVVSFSGLWGRLDRRCRPADNTMLFAFPSGSDVQTMTKPYMELSVGLDNIFRVLRVDYVWRLNYRHVPYAIDRSGVRVALHFTF